MPEPADPDERTDARPLSTKDWEELELAAAVVELSDDPAATQAEMSAAHLDANPALAEMYATAAFIDADEVPPEERDA